MQVEALPSSRLGTKEHWNRVYDREINTFDEIGDEGEVWFGEEAVQRMINFIEDAREEHSLAENMSVLDVGTGNGHLLFELLELSPPATKPQNMLGIDYSRQSVELCKRIARTRSDEAIRIPFEEVDFLLQSDHLKRKKWDLICDKGTLDAIALSARTSQENPVRNYVSSMENVCPSESIFLIASCNFTQDELIQIFSHGFSVFKLLPAPTFSFGGKKGSTTTTIAFKRNR